MKERVNITTVQETPIKRGRGRPRKIENTEIIPINEQTKPRRKRFEIPKLPIFGEEQKKLTVSFPIESEFVTETKFSDEDKRKKEIKVFHLYPKLSDWPARKLPDAPNPRSHSEECLASPVAKAIESTLRDRTPDFHFINRGLTIMANKFELKDNKVIITLTDPQNHGVADGATTDAVISKIQSEIDSIKQTDSESSNPLERGRVRVEAIVGLTDHDKIGWLVEGRNTSRQVKSWSLSEFRGHFDWLQQILERDGGLFKDKIGWEENAGKPFSVLDVLSLLTLFHPEWDQSSPDGKIRAPVIAYSSKGKLDSRLTHPDLLPGYKSLSSVVEDILKLHDYVYSNFEKHYDTAYKGKTKLGRRIGFESRLQDKPFTLSLTGTQSNYIIENGILFPLLASLRALIKYSKDKTASWKKNPFRFYDEHAPILIAHLIEQLESVGNSPNMLGKSKLAYVAIHREAMLLLAKDFEPKE